MYSKYPKSRSLPRARTFEPLEIRRMLAGNVTADASSGQLVINGDNSANVLLLTQVGANSFKLTGGATKINGSNSPQTFNNVDDGIFINMGGGSDVLTLKNLNIQGATEEISLGILLGDGNDALVMTGVTTSRACGIIGGNGNDAIAILKSTFGYDLAIETFSGHDAVAISQTTVDGGLSIQLGNGNNALSMFQVNVVAIEEIGIPSGELPPGFENLEEIFLVDCGAEIDSGSGADAIAMNQVVINCLTEIETGAGNDSVAIVNSTFGNPVIQGITPDIPGNSDDIEFSGLCIETGLGSDAVTIVNTKVYGFLQIDTSGAVDCPTDMTETPEQESTGMKDGNDAVTLNNVQVLVSETAIICDESPDSGGNDWDPDWAILESGMLLIYTGNGSDAVVLNKVTTTAEAAIYTTDDTSMDGADSVVITNSSFNTGDEEMPSGQLPEIVPGGLIIETGDGNDAVVIVNVNVVEAASIDTGDGTDKVAINALAADFIFVDLEAGNYDALTIVNSSASDAAFSGGGNTGDTLVQSHNHFTSEAPPDGFQYVIG